MKQKLILLIIPLLFIIGCSEKKWFTPKEKHIMIAHALGGIDRTVYTNSKEAFLFNYDKGYRWFELDLTLVKDGNLVCFHERKEKHLGIGKKKIEELTSKKFEKLKYDKKYQQMSFKGFLEMIKDKDDLYVVIDTKFWDKRLMQTFVKEINEVDSDLFKKMIPQIYKEKDMKLIEEVDKNHTKFASLIFTLYAMDNKKISNDDIINTVKKYKIPIVTMPIWDRVRLTKKFIQRLHKENVYTLVHTINSDNKAKKLYKEYNIDGLYTDFYIEKKIQAK